MKIFASWRKAILWRILIRNLSVQGCFLPYKGQCLKKVNVKYVINRLWHELFHIILGISPRPISVIQLHCRAWYWSLGLIPGSIWKMYCNNLLITIWESSYGSKHACKFMIKSHLNGGRVACILRGIPPSRLVRYKSGTNKVISIKFKTSMAKFW
jgi:hypothetical protein